MTAYESFATVYDLFMDNVPYKTWADNLTALLARHGICRGLVADLGCGTGAMTRELAARGFDMTGIDGSCDMLGVAMEQPADGILYLCQDLREMELYGTMAAMVSVCDTMNYLTSEEDLRRVFSLVNNYLDPGGIFVFDMNTPYKYASVLRDQTFAENRAEGSFIWENEYDEERRLNYYGLTLFLRREDGAYDKYEEEHVQRAYRPEEVKEALREAGMLFVECLDADTLGELREDSQRMYIVARENGKTKG